MHQHPILTHCACPPRASLRVSYELLQCRPIVQLIHPAHLLPRPRPLLLCTFPCLPTDVLFPIHECAYLIVHVWLAKCLSSLGKRIRRNLIYLQSTAMASRSQDGRTHGSGRESTLKRSSNSCTDAQQRSSQEVHLMGTSQVLLSKLTVCFSTGRTFPPPTIPSFVRP